MSIKHTVLVLKDVVSTSIISGYLRSLGDFWAKGRVIVLVTFVLKAIYFGSTPHPVTVANKGLYRDSQLVLICILGEG